MIIRCFLNLVPSNIKSIGYDWITSGLPIKFYIIHYSFLNILYQCPGARLWAWTGFRAWYTGTKHAYSEKSGFSVVRLEFRVNLKFLKVGLDLAAAPNPTSSGWNKRNVFTHNSSHINKRVSIVCIEIITKVV